MRRRDRRKDTKKSHFYNVYLGWEMPVKVRSFGLNLIVVAGPRFPLPPADFSHRESRRRGMTNFPAPKEIELNPQANSINLSVS